MDASSYFTQPPNHSGNHHHHHHHHNAAAPSSNSHQRSASHASYGSHTDMFDCDLNARDFFGGGGSNSNNATSKNVTGDANNDVMTTSSANEDFSHYMNPSNNSTMNTLSASASAASNNYNNDNSSSRDLSNNDDDAVHYEGVALQTALNAFGSVASAVVGGMQMASSDAFGVGVAGTSNNNSNTNNSADNNNNSSSGALGLNMSGWRNRLVEVVAPQQPTAEKIHTNTNNNNNKYGEQRNNTMATGYLNPPPTTEGTRHYQEPQYAQQRHPHGDFNTPDNSLSHSEIIHQQESSYANRNVSDSSNPTTSMNYNPQQQQQRGVVVAPSPNSTPSWQMVNTNNNAATATATASMTITNANAVETIINPSSYQQQQREPRHNPMSHQLSALEKARHDSTTFQYADPLIGTVSSSSLGDGGMNNNTMIHSSMQGTQSQPPVGMNHNSTDRDNYSNNTATAYTGGQLFQGVVSSGEEAVAVVAPVTAADLFGSSQTNEEATASASLLSNNNPMYSNQSPSTATTPMMSSTNQPSFASSNNTQSSSSSLTTPKPLPAPRSGNKRLQLSLPKKPLPLPPPMPRKKNTQQQQHNQHGLPSNNVSIANSSVGSRSNTSGYAPHFKKPPPMEVNASPRFMMTPTSSRQRGYSPRIAGEKSSSNNGTTTNNNNLMTDLSPLPSPRLEWKTEGGEDMPPVQLEAPVLVEETVVVMKEAGSDEVDNVIDAEEEEKKTVISDVDKKSNEVELTADHSVPSIELVAPPSIAQPDQTAVDHDVVVQSMDHDAIPDIQNRGQTTVVPVMSQPPPPIEYPAATMPTSNLVPPNYNEELTSTANNSAMIPQTQESEESKDWNIVASKVVQETLDDAVNQVAEIAQEEQNDMTQTVPPPSLHVTFSATAPPIHHGPFPDAESSRVTECDAMSDYQSFVQDEDVPPIASKDDNDCVMPSPSMVSQGTESLVDSSMVAEYDTSDYQGELRETEIKCIDEPSSQQQSMQNLPDGWVEGVDETTGRVYYYNTVTQQSSWTIPVIDCLDPNAPSLILGGDNNFEGDAYVDTAPVEDFNAGENECAEALPSNANESQVVHSNEVPDIPDRSHPSEYQAEQPLNDMEYEAPTASAETHPLEYQTQQPEMVPESQHIIEQSPANNVTTNDETTLENSTAHIMSDELLPPGWTEGYEEISGRVYYYNEISGESSWERPSHALDSSEEPHDSSVSPVEVPPAEMTGGAMTEHANDSPVEHTAVEDNQAVAEMHQSETEMVPEENPPSKQEPLPEGWFEAMGPNGKPFYVCQANGQISWEHPNVLKETKDNETAEAEPDNEILEDQHETESNDIASNLSFESLPDGWIEGIDQQTGKKYYYHESTNESRWDRPVESDDMADDKLNMPDADIQLEAEEVVKPETAVVTDVNREPEDISDSFVDVAASEAPVEAETVSDGFIVSPIGGEDVAVEEEQKPLPAGWREAIDPSSGNTYYFNESSGETLWTRPEEVEYGIVDNEVIRDEMVDEGLPNTTDDDIVLEKHVAPADHFSADHGVDAMGASNEDESQAPPGVEDDNITTTEESAPLPVGWQEAIDPSTGNTYYFNESTGETSWTLPEEKYIESLNNSKTMHENTGKDSSIQELNDMPLKCAGNVSDEVAVDSMAVGTVEDNQASSSIDNDITAEESAALPAGWQEATDPSSGNIYYFNELTGETSWTLPEEKTSGEKEEESSVELEHNRIESEEIVDVVSQSPNTTAESSNEDSPSPHENKELPEGWVASKDPSSGKVFYYNEATGESSWEVPLLEEKIAEPVPESPSTEMIVEPVEDSTTKAVESENLYSNQRLSPAASTDNTVDDDLPTSDKRVTTLPKGWVAAVDSTSGKTYYYNKTLGETSWTLPHGGEIKLEPSSSTNEMKQKIDEPSSTIVHPDMRLATGSEGVQTKPDLLPETIKPSTVEAEIVPANLAKNTSRSSGDRNRPAHAIALFGFGGRLCVMIPQVAKSLSGAAIPSSIEGRKTLRRGPVVIHQLRSLIPREHKYSIPAQLSLPMIKSRDEEVMSFIDKKCSATNSLIWNVVQIAAQNGGRLKDDIGAVVDLLLSPDDENSNSEDAHNNSVPQSLQVPIPPSVDHNMDLEEIQRQMMRGNREEAVDEALQNKNYALALLIGGMSGFDTYQIVAQRFADEVLSPGSPLHTVALMLSKNLELPSTEDLADPGSESFWSDDIYNNLGSTWKHQLASILSNRKEGWNKIVLTLGDRLMQLEKFDGAHVCYLMCGYSIGTNWNLPTRFLLLGCDHDVPLHSELMTPEAIESFLCTEAFEWARRRGNRRTCLQSLQVFKLRYAELLADYGYVDLAREYVVSIRQLTGIGLDENDNSQAPPMSGSLIPVFPDDFVDRLYRFEDRLCVMTGAELSCKRKETEQRKSAIAAIAGGLGSMFGRKSSDTSDNIKTDLLQQENKLDEPSSENEFMDIIEKKPSASAANSKSIDKPSDKANVYVESHQGNTSLISSEAPPNSKSTLNSDTTTQPFTPFQVSKPPEERESDGMGVNPAPTREFPPVSAPPTLGDDGVSKSLDDKQTEDKEQDPIYSSTPSSKKYEQKAPSSEPPRSGGWLSKLLGRDKESKAKVADVGEEMQAYYDEKLKRWIFPGDDPAEVAKPLAPPPIMTPKADAPASTPAPASNDPLAALMAPPSRLSTKRSGPPSRRYADPLASMGNVSSTPMSGLPPISSKTESPMRDASAAPPKFAVFQPKPKPVEEKAGDEKEN